MTNLKALKALQLFDDPPQKETPRTGICISLRLPGDTSDRVFSMFDEGPDDHLVKGATATSDAVPAKRYISRNTLLVALIEAGLEAVEAARLAPPKTLKSRKK